MGVLWFPGQDVDFLGRLARLEQDMRRITSRKSSMLSSPVLDVVIAPEEVMTTLELEAENEELRARIDDLEENVIILTAELAKLESRLTLQQANHVNNSGNPVDTY